MKIGLIFVIALSSVSLVASASNKCALAVMPNGGQGLTIESLAVELDGYGNKLPVTTAPKPLRWWSRLLPKKPATVGPRIIQKAPLDPQYFLESFRPELERLVRDQTVTLAQLRELGSRLLQAEETTSGDQYYLLRLDDLKTPLTKVKVATQALFFSIDPDNSFVLSPNKEGGRRVAKGFDFLGRVEDEDLAEAKERDREGGKPEFIRRYKLSDGQLLQIRRIPYLGFEAWIGSYFDLEPLVPGRPVRLQDVIDMYKGGD